MNNKTIRVRHTDCGGTRRKSVHDGIKTVGGYAVRDDGTRTRFLALLDAAISGHRAGKGRDCSGFSKAQMGVLAQADLIGVAGGTVEEMDAARKAFMQAHADVINLGSNMAASNEALPDDPADMESYDVDERERAAAGSLAGSDEEGPKAEISIKANQPKAGSAMGATDGMSARDRAAAIAAKSVQAMTNAAKAFWSSAPKPSTTPAIDKMNEANAKFWG